MKIIKTILFDIGGVLLTNGWDRYQRASLVEKYGIDKQVFSTVHSQLVEDLDGGRISFSTYLDRVIPAPPTGFSKSEFERDVRALSQPFPEMLELARSFVGRYRLGTLNNESKELHEYRVKEFDLDKIFSLFCCSAYLNCTKPGREIYEKTLGILAGRPDEIVFIDDREGNVKTAQSLGIHAIHHVRREETENELRRLLSN